MTATGATVAESAPQDFDLNGTQSAMARTQQVASEEMASDLALRRQDATLQSAIVQGRSEAKVRATRAAQREAAAAAAAKAKAEREGKYWVRPIKVWNITSWFGPRWGTQHDGLDLGAPTGTPLYALSKGTVINAGWEDSFGNKLEVQYWDGSVIWYGHMSRIDVKTGDTVMPGELVGAVGNTGHSFGSHLHFEVQQSATADTPTNPVPWLKRHGLW